MAKTLQLNFSTTTGKNVMLTVDEPRANPTATAIEAMMQAIIATVVFEVNGVPLETSKGACIVERNVTELITE